LGAEYKVYKMNGPNDPVHATDTAVTWVTFFCAPASFLRMVVLALVKFGVKGSDHTSFPTTQDELV